MKKTLLKLSAAAMSLVLAVTVTVVASYAWLTLSESPSVQGIQIAIGGGNTILLAADVVEQEDGVEYHYPGEFSDTLNFSRYDTYDFLSELGGLTPVSTADGVNWFLPDYYDGEDEEVTSGLAQSGQLKPVTEFLWENDLTHANLTTTQQDLIAQGSYVCLDFWVVSPNADYQLRVSVGDDGTGSFLIGLMEPVQVDTNGDGIEDALTLAAPAAGTAASARIGFLANEERLGSEDVLRYLRSADYNNQYDVLKGVYSPKGVSTSGAGSRFTIYEPNGLLHADEEQNGTYLVTNPLGVVDGVVQQVDISDRVTVQSNNTWLLNADQSGVFLEQVFQAAFAGQEFRDLIRRDLMGEFYGDYLQQQVASYVHAADFVKSTSNLFRLESQGMVSAGNVEAAGFAGATDDVYIVQLEKNIPQRIQMFIWLEGLDSDSVNIAEASGFALNLELAGSSIQDAT